MNYHGKTFRPIQNSENGETSEETEFLYQQHGTLLTCTYHGGQIVQGHILGLVDPQGVINMHYHQINTLGEIRTGKCRSIPEILPNGKIRLHESWEWTNGDLSVGQSIIEEL